MLSYFMSTNAPDIHNKGCSDLWLVTCKDKGDAHKGASLSVSLLGLHADVDDLPGGVCLEDPGLAGREEAGEGVACAICAFRLSVHRLQKRALACSVSLRSGSTSTFP